MRLFNVCLLLALVAVLACGCGGSSDDSSDSTLTTTTSSFDATGGTTSLALNLPDGTAWTADSPGTWLTLGSYSGTGSTTIPVQVDQNTIAAERWAKVSIAGGSVRLTQSSGNGGTRATFQTASFELPDTMTASGTGAWQYDSGSTLLELQASSQSGHLNLNAIESGYATHDAAYYKLRRRTLIDGHDAYVVDTVPDQDGISRGSIWINHGTDWYIFSTRTKNADLIYVLTTSLQFS